MLYKTIVAACLLSVIGCSTPPSSATTNALDSTQFPAVRIAYTLELPLAEGADFASTIKHVEFAPNSQTLLVQGTQSSLSADHQSAQKHWLQLHDADTGTMTYAEDLSTTLGLSNVAGIDTGFISSDAFFINVLVNNLNTVFDSRTSPGTVGHPRTLILRDARDGTYLQHYSDIYISQRRGKYATTAIYLVNLATGERVETYYFPYGSPESISPDGTVWSASPDGWVFGVKEHSSENSERIEWKSELSNPYVFTTEDSSFVVAVGDDYRCEVRALPELNKASACERPSLWSRLFTKNPKAGASGGTAHPASDTIALAWANTVDILTLDPFQRINRLELDSRVTQLVMTETVLVTATRDKIVLADIKTGALIGHIPVQGYKPVISVSADGRLLAYYPGSRPYHDSSNTTQIKVFHLPI